MNANAMNQIERNVSFSFTYSTVMNRLDSSPAQQTIDLETFFSRLTEVDRKRGELDFEDYHALDPLNPGQKQRRSQEKDGPGWLPCSFRAGGRRTTADVVAITAIVLDCDDGEISLETIRRTLDGTEYFAHSTYSHRLDKPKWRVIIPLESPISPAQLPLAFGNLNRLFAGRLDPCGRKPAQLYYLPSCPFDANFEYHHERGALFSLPPTATKRPSGLASVVSLPPGRHLREPASASLPGPCRDGERHNVLLAALGRWIAEDRKYDEVLGLAREWNQKNFDPWPDDVLVSKVDGMFRTDRNNHPERYITKPWGGTEVPEGHLLNMQGVFLASNNDDKPSVRVCGPAWVTARARNADGQGWGTLVNWVDDDGVLHECCVPSQRFHEPGNGIAQELASDGLNIVPGKERQLYTYLNGFTPRDRVRSVSQLGWMHTEGGHLEYVLPSMTIGGLGNERVVFQPEQHSPSSKTIRSAGLLEEWQIEVAELAVGNPYLMFVLCLAFAGPLLWPAGLEGGGFHLYGRSSFGKTTAAQLAASVWGCGADPSETPRTSYVRRWNTTHNALEGLAAAHNDNLLILDEAGTCGARDFGRLIYDLAGGQGKMALNANRSLKQSRAWRVLFLSTGEISTAQKIEEDGKAARDGQLLRMLDIPVHDGIIHDSRGMASADFANRIKQACGRYFGTAGPTLLKKIIDAARTPDQLTKHVRRRWAEAEKDLAVMHEVPEVDRAIRRLALVLTAGRIAVKLGVLPFEVDQVTEAVKIVRDAVLADAGLLPRATRLIGVVREFLLRHEARFGDANTDDRSTIIRDRAGFIDRKEKLFLFTQSGFAEACQGYDTKEVCRALVQRRLLRLNESDRYQVKRSIPGLDRSRFYAITFEILSVDDDGLPYGNLGALGQSQ